MINPKSIDCQIKTKEKNKKNGSQSRFEQQYFKIKQGFQKVIKERIIGLYIDNTKSDAKLLVTKQPWGY